ncbi:coiled-coil domain-containing protein, partial [Mycoplasma marinum]
MKVNKKILLGSVLVPLAIAAPVISVVSCGSSKKMDSTLNKQDHLIIKAVEKNKKTSISDIEMSKYSATPYSASAIAGIMDVFKNIDKTYFKNFKGELKGKAIKTLDQAIIALYGYLANRGNTPDEVKKAKVIFARELTTLKADVNELFDVIFTNKHSGANLILNSLVKEAPMKDMATALSIKIFGKLKFMLNNIIDTMINVEDVEKNMPKWTKNKNVSDKGSLANLKDFTNKFDAEYKKYIDAKHKFDKNTDEINANNKILSNLEKEALKVKETIKDLKGKIKNNDSEIKKMEEDKKLKQSDLQGITNEIKSKEDELSEQIKLFNASKTVFDNAKSTKNLKDQNVQTAQSVLDAATLAKTTATTLINTLIQKIANIPSELAILKKTLDTAALDKTNADQDLATKNSNKATATQNKTAASTLVDNLEQKITTATSELAILKKTLDAATLDKTNADQDLATKDSNKTTATQNKTDASTLVDNLEQKITTATSELATLKVTLDAATLDKTNADQDLATKKSNKATATQNKTAATLKVDDIENKIKATKDADKLKKLGSEKLIALSDLATKTTAFDDANNEFTKSQKAAQDAQTALDDATKKHTDKKAELSKLNNDKTTADQDLATKTTA